MKSDSKKRFDYQEFLKTVTTIVSWTIFTLLMICAAFLVYYVIAMQLYVRGVGKDKVHIAPKFSLYTIVSPSMYPNILPNDVIIDSRIDSPEDIKIGDIITFYASEIPEVHGNTITHRVIAIKKDTEGNYYYRTKGDANLIEDGIDISYKNVVGKVALRIPKLGNIQNFVVYKSGWILILLAITSFIIIRGLLRYLKGELEQSGKHPKLTEYLNRPLIEFNKPKLLTYMQKESNNNKSQEIKEQTKKIEEIKPEDINPQITILSNEPQKETDNETKEFPIGEDEFNINDLPGLK